MKRHFRFVLAGSAFLLVVPAQTDVLFAWHPLSVLVRNLNLLDPNAVCLSSAPEWVTGPVLLVSLGLPCAGLVLAAAVVLATLRRRRTPAVSPALALAGALVAFTGAGAGLVMLLTNGPTAVEGASLHPLQPAWVLLHFVPFWALRLGKSRWLRVAAALVAAFGAFVGLGAVHQARVQAQLAVEQRARLEERWRQPYCRLLRGQLRARGLLARQSLGGPLRSGNIEGSADCP